jgi:hypothetical protein
MNKQDELNKAKNELIEYLEGLIGAEKFYSLYAEGSESGRLKSNIATLTEQIAESKTAEEIISEYFKKVYIKSENDLPKEECFIFVKVL